MHSSCFMVTQTLDGHGNIGLFRRPGPSSPVERLQATAAGLEWAAVADGTAQAIVPHSEPRPARDGWEREAAGIGTQTDSGKPLAVGSWDEAFRKTAEKRQAAMGAPEGNQAAPASVGEGWDEAFHKAAEKRQATTGTPEGNQAAPASVGEGWGAAFQKAIG